MTFDGRRNAGLPYAKARGVATIDLTNAPSGNVDVSFPVGRFTVAPVMSGLVSNFNYVASFSGLTASGFTANVKHSDATATTATVLVHWTAEQATPTSASD